MAVRLGQPEAEPVDQLQVLLDRLASVGQTTDIGPLCALLERLCVAMESNNDPKVMIAPGVAPTVTVQPANVTVQPADVNVPDVNVTVPDIVIPPNVIQMMQPKAATVVPERDSRGFLVKAKITYEY